MTLMITHVAYALNGLQVCSRVLNELREQVSSEMERDCRVPLSALTLALLVIALTWMNTNDSYVHIAPGYQSSKNSERTHSQVNSVHGAQRSSISYNRVPNALSDFELSALEMPIAGEGYSSDQEKYTEAHPPPTSAERPKMDPNCLVNILIYKEGQSGIGRKQGVYKCHELGCSFRLSYSDKPNALRGKDIVLLYLRTKFDWREMVKQRPPGQIWIFYSRESPLHDHGIMPPSWVGTTIYNWTMTYRSDSTILASYGVYLAGEPETAENDTRNRAAGKTKLVAWMASNCNVCGWRRSKFIKQFSGKYLHVDIFGKCGDRKCPKGPECEQIMSRYKFYFALENSICKEYITEKFWRNALSYGSVPIVFGAPKEDYERLAPPNSFIHLCDYRSPEEFRDYLNELDQNDTLYNKYSEWRKHGTVRVTAPGELFLPKTFCKMTEKFLEIRRKMAAGGVRNEIPPLERWWSDSCGNIENCPVVKEVLKEN